MSDTNSELIWYIARDGQQHGPLTDAEMRLFVDSGHLKPTDLVWNPTMTDWQSAAEVFPSPAPAPPPPTPPAPPETAAAAPATHSDSASKNNDDASPSAAYQNETGNAPENAASGPASSGQASDVAARSQGETAAGTAAVATGDESPQGSTSGERTPESWSARPDPETTPASYKPVFTGALPTGRPASGGSSDGSEGAQLSSGSGTSSSVGGASNYPDPDDVLPSLRPGRDTRTGPQAGGHARAQSGAHGGPQVATGAAASYRPAQQQPLSAGPAARPAGPAMAGTSLQNAATHDDDDEEEPRGRGGTIGLLIGSFVLAAVVAGGGLLAYQNQDAIMAYMNTEPDEAPPVVKAEGAAREAASANRQMASLDKGTGSPPDAAQDPQSKPPAETNFGGPDLPGITVTIPPTQPATPPAGEEAAGVPLQTIDSNLQKSQLWQVVKQEFPDWYGDRVKEISRLSGSASEAELSKHLIQKLVALRREHAQFALASDTEHLRNIASAFLANLKSLAGHSTEACYTFISRGETSPDVISLFPKPGYGDAIEGQIAAVFRAVAAGRKSPVNRQKATKPDYDVLAQELTKIGWSKEDLGLFANPQALAKAPPDRVCRMVQDWFSAHVSIADKGVQERLLVETLRPVIAG